MRLINTTTLEPHEFFNVRPDEHFPKHAILSHCWTSDEVGYKDFVKKRKLENAGYRKIGNACKLAHSRGFEWLWVDTCADHGGSSCIDKRSSAELSEAINSMYNYYAEAEECHAFLDDVEFEAPEPEESAVSKAAKQELWLSAKPNQWLTRGPEDTTLFRFPAFSKSRWFSRGWTLQELIAPSIAVFLGRDWEIIGLKRGSRRSPHGDRNGSHYKGEFPSTFWIGKGQDTLILREVSSATGIPEITLLDPDHSLRNDNVATRLSWMANRSTTRVEDEAYCLLGLFNLNMSLLYGEGARAFFRLQSETIRVSADESIFYSKVRNFALLPSTPQDYLDHRGFNHYDHRSVERLSYSITNQGLGFEILPRSGAYVGSSTDAKRPDLILISLNGSARSGAQMPWYLTGDPVEARFLLVKRLMCGHYIRRQIPQLPLWRVLSKEPME